MSAHKQNPTQYTSQEIDNESYNDAYKIREAASYGYQTNSDTFKPLLVDSNGNLLVSSSSGGATEITLAGLKTDIETRFISGKLSYGGILNTSGDNVIITPPAGKSIVVYWVTFIPNSDNSVSNLVTVKFATSSINLYIGYAVGHSEIFTGAVNEVLTVNLTNTQPVAVTVHYKLI